MNQKLKEYCFLLDTSGDQDITEILPNDTYIMPFSIIINDGKTEKTYNDWQEISTNQVVEALNHGYDVKTSQTPYGLLYEKVESLLQSYQRIFIFTITKEFSGTYNSFINIKKALEEKYGKDRIIVIDTEALGYMQNIIVQTVKLGLDQNKSISEIEKAIKIINNSLTGFTTITNATQLTKGGRLKGLKALLVKALNIKLVIRYLHGKLDFYDKSFNLAGAIDKGIEAIDKQLNLKKNPPRKVLIISDFSNPEELNKLINYVEMRISTFADDQPIEYIFRKEFPTAIVTHLGPNYFTVLVYANHKPIYA